MNRIKLFTTLIIALFFTIQFTKGQETTISSPKVSFDFNADLVSRYVWRGTQFGGASPHLQPGISMDYKGLEFGAWGSYSLAGQNTAQEFDLYLSYTFLNEMLTATLTDYYFPDDTATYNYFEWNKDITGHILEASLSFNGTDNLPLHFLAAVNFYGADAQKINDDQNSPDFNTSTGIQYSNYFELGYNFDVQDVNCDVFVGASLNSPNDLNTATGYLGESGFYGTGPGVVNLGLTASKEIKITEHFSLPLTTSIITNPQAEKIFFVFGISF